MNTTDLLAKLEAAAEGSRALDGEVANAVGWRFERRIPNRKNWWYAPGDETNYGGRSLAPKFTTSIDAALPLVPEGWNEEIRLDVWKGGDGDTYGRCHLTFGENNTIDSETAHSPALAICIAALRARNV